MRKRSFEVISSSLILKKYLYASFSFSYWKYSCTLPIFFVVFMHALVAFTQKSRQAEKNFHNARSLQENLACSAANQSACTCTLYYCSHIINANTAPWKAENKGITKLNSFCHLWGILISTFILCGLSKLSAWEKPEQKLHLMVKM